MRLRLTSTLVMAAVATMVFIILFHSTRKEESVDIKIGLPRDLQQQLAQQQQQQQQHGQHHHQHQQQQQQQHVKQQEQQYEEEEEEVDGQAKQGYNEEEGEAEEAAAAGEEEEEEEEGAAKADAEVEEAEADQADAEAAERGDDDKDDDVKDAAKDDAEEAAAAEEEGEVGEGRPDDDDDDDDKADGADVVEVRTAAAAHTVAPLTTKAETTTTTAAVTTTTTTIIMTPPAPAAKANDNNKSPVHSNANANANANAKQQKLNPEMALDIVNDCKQRTQIANLTAKNTLPCLYEEDGVFRYQPGVSTFACTSTKFCMATAVSVYDRGSWRLHMAPTAQVDPMLSAVAFYNVTVEKTQEAMCDYVMHKPVIVSNLFYYVGYSNIFHMHAEGLTVLWDNMLALGKQMRDEAVIMLAARGRQSGYENNAPMSMTTDAFDNPNSVWFSSYQSLSPNPLTAYVTENFPPSATVCFDKVFFFTKRGLPSWKPPTFRNYVDVVINNLGLRYNTDVISSPERAAQSVILISRGGDRRGTLNEPELVKAAKAAGINVALVRPTANMSFRDQLAPFLNASVIVGMNGAGLTLANYRSPNTVAVQMVPYNVSHNTMNFGEFGSMLAKVGPYLEYHQTHADRCSAPPGSAAYVYPQSANSIDPKEFVELLQDALSLINSNCTLCGVRPLGFEAPLK